MDRDNLFKRFQKSCAIEFICRIKTFELKINQKRKKILESTSFPDYANKRK